jgi:O-antigen/teichoic acid export membrane protein
MPRARKRDVADTKPHKEHKPSFITRIISNWWDRLLGAAADRSFSDQPEQYAAHRTSRDFVWNTAGVATWGLIFPILSMVASQIVGVEQAGMFALAFVTANLLMILGNYGIRSFQVSDINEDYSFSDYQVQRWLTCIAMIIVAFLYCTIRGYDNVMFATCMWICVYKMIDALADVYEGRLQQVDKLYLGGVSQTLRSVLVFIVSVACLLITHDLVVASIAMAIAAAATFLFVTYPLARMETPKSSHFEISAVFKLFKQCLPLFAALFLYALIDNMPKFAMDGVLDYSSQLYFNALYFPAQAILLTVGFIYKPLLVRIAQAWADVKHRRRFDLIVLLIVAITVVITVIGIVLMNWIGMPVLSFLYGADFSGFTNMAIIMLVAGGATGVIDFLYQVITVLRHQKVVTRVYLITFGFSLLILLLLINMTGLPGAVIGYLIVMAILLVLLVWQYLSIRFNYGKNVEKGAWPSADASAVNANVNSKNDDAGSTAGVPAPVEHDVE